ncbi:conserved phage C-terminal domain-containing protein [Priestia flexa]|uniref:Conserved phage C-terminal domain-containing protein n=1 Tax=Priestia flexa TaxID=86664 RepID=A0ABU4J275_9BACI|nr:conserved phage C-terminal domain-containing protein [Priestia flexa]MDW8515083.1 conserved phage C-terminal domain-containing protein [Priestia flexa]
MGICRVSKNKNYVVMNRTALNDERLSWKAKGIIAYMLSMPDDWTFYIEELVKHSTDGEASFRSGFKELKTHGYVKRYPLREGNRITGWETVVHEVPQDDSLDGEFQQVENLHVENEDVENEDVENQRLLSTDSTKYLSKPNTDDTKDNIPFKEIVSYLNVKTSTAYKPSSKKTKQLIAARWKEGFTLDDFKKVIDNKVAEWLNDSKMSQYLRPETLFGTKFESYLNQKGGVTNAKDQAAEQSADDYQLPF